MPVRSTVEILTAAAFLLSDESRWTQGAPARDGYNQPVMPNDKNAVRWSATGAVALASLGSGFTGMRSIEILVDTANGLFGGKGNWPDIAFVNDRMNHRAVMEMFHAALATLRDEDADDDKVSAK